MKFHKILLLAALPAVLSSGASAALLGVTPIEPSFDYNGGGTVVYTAVDGSVAITGTPTLYNIGGEALDIFPLSVLPSIMANFSLDSGCALSGGDPGGDDLIVTADIDYSPQDFVPDVTGAVLTGEIIELGIGDTVSGVTTMDARFAITGGNLVGTDFTLGAEVGMTIVVSASTFTGDCTVDWNGGAKGLIGALEVIDPPVDTCFDVKKLKIREGRMCRSHWGSYGTSRSKVKASLSVGCDAGFDPAASLISLGLDGETFEFPIGSFSQVGTANKYRAWIAGSPSLFATLDCDKGRFSFSASRADTSQIDTADGVDIALVLGGTTHMQNVMLSSTGHHHWGYGHRNVFYYHNNDVENCAVDMGDDETDMHEIKCRHKSSGRLYNFKRSRGGYGKNLLVHDTYSGHFSMINTSKATGVTCGWSDANFEVVGIEHKLASKSCTLVTEDEEDDDVEDNQHD